MTSRFENTKNRIHPLKFALWVGMASITMMFGAFTSAYIVRRASGNWLEFELPNIFLENFLKLFKIRNGFLPSPRDLFFPEGVHRSARFLMFLENMSAPD
mgnify:CR=1 FL=1